jgi:hypothetical protein
MPTFKQPPASWRYLKARLNTLKRPKVWAAASGLMLLLFSVGAYLANPQQYPGSNDPEAATKPPHQNSLGDLPAQTMPASNGELFETLPDLSTVPTQPLPDLQPQRDPRSPLLQDFLLDRPWVSAHKDQPKPSSSALFSTSSEEQRNPPQSRLSSLSSMDSLSSKSASAISSGTADSSTSASSGFSTINPLQSALDRYSSIPSSSPITPAPSLDQSLEEDSSRNSAPLATADPTSQNSWRRPESSLQGLPSPQFTPQISPSPGTTGYTLPSALRPSAPSSSSSSGGSLQPIPGQIAPQPTPAVPGQVYDYGQPSYPTGQTAYPRVQSPSVPASPPTPFSIPRAAPGRSIGGGQINTFSNP